MDRALRLYERRPLRSLRREAIARAEAWIVRRQEADGSWGGIQPPWVYSLMALHLGGYAIEHPVMRRGLEGLERFMVEDRDDARGVGAPAGASRRLEACQSPVWDTALAVVALSDGGLPREHPALERAAQWLLGEEVRVRGDWAVTRPRLEPGGWAFEFENDNYPDVDDTAEVALALLRVIQLEPERVRRANRHRRASEGRAPDGQAPDGQTPGIAGARAGRDRPRGGVGGGDAERRAAAGGPLTRTTRGRSCERSRSLTSAR